MTSPGDLKVAPRGDREIVITRSFNAPRALVWEAYNDPQLLKEWLLGPPGWSMVVCEVAKKVGERYHYVWRHQDGREMGMNGVAREIVAPERVVYTESMDGQPGNSLVTTILVEEAGRTFLTTTAVYDTREVREMVLKSGMEHGIAASYERLDNILRQRQEQAKEKGAGGA